MKVHICMPLPKNQNRRQRLTADDIFIIQLMFTVGNNKLVILFLFGYLNVRRFDGFHFIPVMAGLNMNPIVIYIVLLTFICMSKV